MSLGTSVWELRPGSSQFVYHFHHGSEELLVVLGGRPVVRLHDGDRRLEEGDVVSCPRGPEGGHQLRNDGETTAHGRRGRARRSRLRRPGRLSFS